MNLRYLTLVTIALGAILGSGNPAHAFGANPADLVEPNQHHAEFGNRVRQAESNLDILDSMAAALRDASQRCLDAGGEASACAGLERARTRYDNAKRVYDESAAAVVAWRGHFADAIAEKKAGCPTLWGGWRRRNCQTAVEGYENQLPGADQTVAALTSRATSLTQGAEGLHSRAVAARTGAADAATRAREEAVNAGRQWARDASPEAIAARIASCRTSPEQEFCKYGLVDEYRTVYEQKSGNTIHDGMFPLVRSFAEACTLWGSSAAICRDGAIAAIEKPSEARARIVAFLQGTPGGRNGCRVASERCWDRRVSFESEATRLAPGEDPIVDDPADRPPGGDGTVTPGGPTDRQQAAIDMVLNGDPDGSIECKGGENGGAFGQGVVCGERGTVRGQDPGDAPAFVSTDLLTTTNVLGSGATVMSGDTLSEIAQKVRRQMNRRDIPLYGEGGMVKLLAHANGKANPDRIDPGEGVRVPTLECLAEAADKGGTESYQVLDDCEALVRVKGVPANLSVALRMARERIARLEEARIAAGDGPFPPNVRQEILMDAANNALSPANDFDTRAGPPEEFIRIQVGVFGEAYRDLISQVARDAQARGYSTDERFRLLHRRIREQAAARTE